MFPTISSKIGATVKGKNLFLREHVVSFKSSPYDKGGNILIGKIFFIAFFTQMRKMRNGRSATPVIVLILRNPTLYSSSPHLS